jgi:predicted ATPase
MPIYLKRIQLLKEHHNLNPFFLYFKEGLNIIVGENGSGKSTLLDLVTGNHSKELVKLDFEKGAQYRFLDTEKHNPRTKSNLSESKNIMFEVSARFMSHGEAILMLLEGAKDFKDLLLIVDEPEAGVSLKNQIKVLDILNKLVKEANCQVLLATHSYPIIKSEEQIYSMDLEAWIDSKGYLNGIFNYK